MPVREDQLNGRIASLINRYAGSMGWSAFEETDRALRGEGNRPDIIIARQGAPPIAVENEYAPAATVEDDCLKRIGRELDSSVVAEAGRVNSVIAVRSPRALNQCPNGDVAETMLLEGIELEYAVYHGTKTDFTRFPARGFLTGNIRNLIEFIKPAAVHEDAVNKAATSLSNAASDVAVRLVRHYTKSGFGARVAALLRQPWPTANPLPETKREVLQEKRDSEARVQTARMCAAIFINALAYQENLAVHHEDIRDIAKVREDNAMGKWTKLEVLDEWQNILAINYWPIFHIARRLLLALPPAAVEDIMPRMASTAQVIHSQLRQNDVAGIVFQRLIVDRQTLATYYTRPESTVLAAHLSIPEAFDWADPDLVKNYHIADYACGTGGLMLAAYERVRDLHRNHGGDPDDLHAHMMENSLTACDIMPAAVHLSASLLSSVAPDRQYKGTRNILYPFGGARRVDSRGSVMTDSDGRPVIERDADGKPIVDIGSLELLDLKSSKHQVVLPLNERMVVGSNGKRRQIEIEITPMSADLVIMNPPFTTPTNHAADHVDTKNPAFAAFDTSNEEQKAMEERVKALSKGTCGDGYAGLGSQFAAIANNMVKTGGHIALILPVSAMLGGSHQNGVYRSWQKLRRLLAQWFNDIVVVTIASPTSRDSAFSADTDLAECLVIARRRRTNESPSGRAHFVNLKHRPDTKLAAQETARSIRRVVNQLQELDTSSTVRIGDHEVGWVRLESVNITDKWTAARVLNEQLLDSVKNLTIGNLSLPQRVAPVSIPITSLSEIGKVGPVHRKILSVFTKRDGYNPGTEYPMLWNHDELKGKTQVRMSVPPDSSGFIKSGQSERATEIWHTAGHLHLCNDFGFNANAIIAAWTETRSLGGRAWPIFQMPHPAWEKATCVWLNSTLGLMSFWIESNRSQSGRGSTTVTALPNICSLDVSTLEEDALNSAVEIFDDMCEQDMLPANEAYRDPVRQELDNRLLTEVLGLDDSAPAQLNILRNQWCAEPTVNGTKKTGIIYNS